MTAVAYPLLSPSPRALRLWRGLTLARAAAEAGVCVATLKLYEADPASVSDASRWRLHDYYAQLR